MLFQNIYLVTKYKLIRHETYVEGHMSIKVNCDKIYFFPFKDKSETV